MPFGLGFFATAGAGAAGSTFQLLQSTVLTTNTASVTFSNLNTFSDYRHLQIRVAARDTNSFGQTIRDLNVQFNGDSANNYWGHEFIGESTGVFSQTLGNTNRIRARATIDDSATANVFVASVWDIYNFSNTSMNKTVRIFSGADQGNTSARIVLSSGYWNNTSAITSITITGASSHKAGSRFSLYGVR